jgi:hypothetical protein
MPPFGFGLSMPNLRKVGGAAPFVPVTLVQDNWVGSGTVSGRTPSPISGSGTWQLITTEGVVVCELGSAKVFTEDPPAGVGTFRHSVQLTNATVSSTYSGEAAHPSDILVWARSTPGPTGAITQGYYIDVRPTEVSLYKRVAGVNTLITTVACSPYNVVTSFTVSGTTLRVVVNGVQVIQTTDNAISSAGYFGCSVSTTYGSDSYVYTYVGPITIATA